MKALPLDLPSLRLHALNFLKGLLLPLLAAAYPVLYTYSSNADQLDFINLRLPLGSAMIAAGVAYLIFLAVQRRTLTASLSAALFVALFHGYGAIYGWLVEPDVVMVEHYWLLPLVLTVLMYAAMLIARLKPEPARALHMVLLVAAAALVAYNVVVSSRTEMASVSASGASAAHASALGASPEEGKTYPDIYYIVFDEYAGFDVLREYFHDNSVDTFEQYLDEKGFYLADRSRAATLSTIVEISSRLDLTRYNEDLQDKVMIAALRENEVMQVLKAYGYTTVAIDMAFQGIHADHTMFFDANQLGGMAVDEFQTKFVKETMLRPFERLFIDSFPSTEKQAQMIYDSLEMTASQDIEGPKFVFTHILLPHMPFIFDAQGNLLDPAYREDWNYYLGQYKYSTKVAMELLDKLLAQADPDNPPVIIFQSDHGARNISARTKDKDRLFLNRRLENYSLSKYAYTIVNALYLPGYDYSTLKRDMEPVQTFELVLNHYLDAGVQVKEPDADLPKKKK